DARNRRLLQFNPKTAEFRSFVVPKLRWGSPMSNSMASYSDGTLWFTAVQAGVVGRLTPATATFSTYEIPITARNSGTANVASKKRPAPTGIATSGDGKIWFADDSFDSIGRLDPATGGIEEFPIPLRWNGHIGPRKVVSDANGDIWVAFHGAGKLMKI